MVLGCIGLTPLQVVLCLETQFKNHSSFPKIQIAAMPGLNFTLSHPQDIGTSQACNPQVLKEIDRFSNHKLYEYPKT